MYYYVCVTAGLFMCFYKIELQGIKNRLHLCNLNIEYMFERLFNKMLK